MTTEELNAMIAEIIIPQEKPKSKGNSHRRKHRENRKYWRLCTIRFQESSPKDMFAATKKILAILVFTEKFLIINGIVGKENEK